jgi:hypothetical protein
VTKYGESKIVLSLVLRLESSGSHSGQCRRLTKLDEALEFGFHEKDVLSFDPTYWRRKLIRKELDEDDVSGAVLTMPDSPAPTSSEPCQDEVKMSGHELGVIPRHIERFGHQIKYVLADEHIGIKMSSIDRFREI